MAGNAAIRQRAEAVLTEKLGIAPSSDAIEIYAEYLAGEERKQAIVAAEASETPMDKLNAIRKAAGFHAGNAPDAAELVGNLAGGVIGARGGGVFPAFAGGAIGGAGMRGVANMATGRPATEGVNTGVVAEGLGAMAGPVIGNLAKMPGRAMQRGLVGTAGGQPPLPRVRGALAGAETMLGDASTIGLGLGKLRRGIEGLEAVMDDDAIALFHKAEEMGIPLGSTEVGPRKGFTRGFQQVVGKFPLVGRSIRQSQVERFAAVDKAHNTLIRRIKKKSGDVPGLATQSDLAGVDRTRKQNRKRRSKADVAEPFPFAPTHRMDDLSVRAVEAAPETMQAFRGEAARLQSKIDAADAISPLLVPAERFLGEIKGIRKGLRESGVKVRRKFPILDAAGNPKLDAEGNPLTRLETRTATRDDLPVSAKLMDDLAGMQDMGQREYKDLLQRINSGLNDARGDVDTRILMQLKMAAKESLDDVEGGGEVVKAMQEFRDFYQEGMALFQRSRAGKGIQRSEKNLLGTGATVETLMRESDALKFFMKETDAKTIRELRHVILGKVGGKNLSGREGRKLWRNIVATHLDDTFARTTKVQKQGGAVVEVMDPTAARTALGLDGTGGQRREGLREMLRGTGVSVKEVEDLLTISEVALQQVPLDVNQFVLRRAVLGGDPLKTFFPFSGLLSNVGKSKPAAAAATAGVASTFLGMVMVVATDQLGKLLADPAFVKAAIRSQSPNLTEAALRRQIAQMQKRVAVALAGKGTAERAGAAAGRGMSQAERFIGQLGQGEQQ